MAFKNLGMAFLINITLQQPFKNKSLGKLLLVAFVSFYFILKPF